MKSAGLLYGEICKNSDRKEFSMDSGGVSCHLRSIRLCNIVSTQKETTFTIELKKKNLPEGGWTI